MPTPKLTQPPLPKLRFTITCVLEVHADEVNEVEETLNKCREYGEAVITSVELIPQAPSPRKRS